MHGRKMGTPPGSLLDLALHALARPAFSARIVSLTRDVRDRRDERTGLVDFSLRTPNDHRASLFSLEGGLGGLPSGVSD